MPCMRSTIRQRRRFLPHLPPSSMRCSFSPELVPPLFHAMRGVFQKRLENDSADGSSPPPSPLTPTASPSLIPKPSGEVGRVGRGGYTLRDILEQQHGWEDGLYQKIRERASKEFPVLLEYEGNWVVHHDYLHICLKNRAQKAKKDQQQKDKEPEAKGKARVADHSSWLLLANLPVF
ncbi:hypothetical protein EDB84DRAFT_1445145 [Lactarius hengduanensis]|nr:hypothetical protein EDB84DRAFT_1445145 [Lactarius hengduanensis]